MTITPKNWKSFQHYKDRAPSWIKLHKGLLNDFEFTRLPVASRALAPMLWLLASEYEDGMIEGSNEKIAFRVHMTVADLEAALKPLIDSGFFVCSEMLAECKQEAIPEKEDIGKRNIEQQNRPDADAPRARAVERRRRKGVQTALPDNYPMPDAVRAYGESLGLTGSEVAREHQRFCNHAKQNDRRCVDWIAAERNWFIGAAERLGRPQPVSSSSGASDGLIEITSEAELAAWDEYGKRKTGKTFPRNSRGGWRFPSRWPPGYVVPA